MTRFLETRVVPQRPEAVSALVFDWSRDPSWRPAVEDMRTEPAGRAVLGQRIVERLRFAGSTYVTPTQVVSVTATSVAFAGGSAGVVVSGRRTVVAHGEGSRVTVDLDIAMTGWRRPLLPLLTPGYRKRQRADVDRLVGLLGERPAVVAGRP